MSLRVDLILPEEQRSAGGISAKSVGRIGTIAVPAIIVFLVAHQFFNSTLSSSELRVLESRWETAEPKQNHALKLAGRLRYNQDTIRELEAWKTSQITWHKQLLAIMEAAPADVQLTTLIVSQAREGNTAPSPPVRRFTLTVEGKTSGENAMQYVEAFREGVATHLHADVIASVDVANYSADTSKNADALDRVFQLDCVYKEHPMELKP